MQEQLMEMFSPGEVSALEVVRQDLLDHPTDVQNLNKVPAEPTDT